MRKLIIAITLLGFTTVLAQQNNEILMTVGGTPVTLAEFENIYHKNNANVQNQEEQSVEEYIELFTNFKLKVHEALELKLDTDKAFINELAGYRKQLAKPYLEDREVTEKLIKEAYERMKYDIRAKHILVVLPNDPTPEDTIRAYTKMLQIRKKAMAKNADFDQLMAKVKTPGKAEKKEVIAEDLGYFTVFQMVYNFETAAYNTPVGQVSEIIRTRFGYHILKVFDKRPSRGEIKVAHIMVSTPKAMTAEQALKKKAKIDEIYGKLKSGEDFAKLAKLYSDDKGSAKKGGELPWFGSGRMVEEFENAAFALENNGDISEPVKTQYGWHIIKRIDKKELKPFEEMEGEIKNKIAKDGRSTKSRTALIEKIKKDYGYQLNEKAFKEMADVVDDFYQKNQWKAEAAKGLDKVLFTLTYKDNSKSYTQQDFARLLQSIQRRYAKATKEEFLNGALKAFVDKSCIDFENSILEDKYLDFKLLMQEYRDGILLFELMDEKVWSKAVKDSAGLRKFYEANKNNYMWDQRVNASIYTCENEEIAAKAKKLIKKQAKKGYTDQYIMEQLNVDSQLNCTIEGGIYQKGDNELIDKVTWQKGIYGLPGEEGKIRFVNVKEVIEPTPKKLDECRGLVTADYQKYLEEEWVKELRAKYPVVVNKEVLSKVK